MFTHEMIGALNAPVKTDNPWSGSYKIPWNDPAFSARMLHEHLSQDHGLASRRTEDIVRQTSWLKRELLGDGAVRILDLGCGPGLYAPYLRSSGNRYVGIDFSPASITYAKEHHAIPGRIEFIHDNVLHADFGKGHDIVLMLFGEMNVFPREDSSSIVEKAFASLKPGGTLAIEVHTMEAVRAAGDGQSWYASRGGLFAAHPHVCLQSNHWFDEHNVAQQVFHVLEEEHGVKTYHNTLQGYGEDEYLALLEDAGFESARFRDDWPRDGDAHRLLTAVKPT